MNSPLLPYKHVMTLTLDVDSANSFSVGATPNGRRTVAPIRGGRFDGELLRGDVLPGGADWVLFRADGVMKIDVRLSLKTDEGSPMYLSYSGQFVASAEAMKLLASGAELPQESYSLTVVARLETGDTSLGWLADSTIVGVGKQSGFNPTYDFYVIGREF